MSDDLVTRLRETCENEHTYDPDKDEAADRIEALEAEAREMALQYLATAGQAQEALAEVERMRGALRALMDVVDHPDQNDNKLSRYHYDWHRIDDEIDSARAALDPKP